MSRLHLRIDSPRHARRRARSRALLAAASVLALSACLSGPGSALSGGAIGVAPDLRASDILPEPDSTAGTGFVLLSNRRDFLDATRLQLSGAGRSYERLFGTRPPLADVRLTSTPTSLSVAVRVAGRPHAPIVIPFDASGRARATEPVRLSFAITRAVSDLWLAELARTLEPAVASESSWVANTRVPLWLRTALLEGVAGASVHDVWLAQLGRTRESLPTVTALMAGEGCDDDCRSAIETLAIPPAPSVARSDAERATPGMLTGRARYRATTASLALFMARREGAPFMRALLAAPLSGRSVDDVIGTATSFSGAADADRQWRVWLATFIDGPGR